jgi:hypothetical protein
MSEFDSYGPALQMAMFVADAVPDAAAVESLAEAARKRFTAAPS